MVAHRPPYDLAGCQIERRGKIQPAFAGRDIGDVDEQIVFGAVATKFCAKIQIRRSGPGVRAGARRRDMPRSDRDASTYRLTPSLSSCQPP